MKPRYRSIGLKNFSLRDLAFLCRCDFGGLAGYLSGRKELPAVQARLAIVLGIPLPSLRKRLGLPPRPARPTMSASEAYQFRRWARARIRERAAHSERLVWVSANGADCFKNHGAADLDCPSGRLALAEARQHGAAQIRRIWNGEFRLYRGRRLIQCFK